MVTKELLDYIKREAERGIPKETTRAMLIQNGWNSSDIEEAEKAISPGIPASPAPSAPKREPEIAKPRIQTSDLLAALQTYQKPSADDTKAQPITPKTSDQVSISNLNNRISQPTPGTTAAIRPVAQISIPETVIQPETAKTARPKSRWKALFLPIAIAFVIVSGGTAYAYHAGYFVSLAKVGTQAFQSLREAKSGSFDTTIKVDLSDVVENPNMLGSLPGFSPNINFSANGSFDLGNADSLALASVVSLKAGTFALGAETRIVEETFYIKATEFPIVPILDADALKDHWLSLPFGKNAESTLPFRSPAGIDTSTFDELTQEQKNHVAELAKNASFITVTKRFTPEEISGVMAYRFTFDLDRDGINTFCNQLETYLHEVGKNSSTLSAFDTKPLRDAIAKIRNFQGKAWIGKGDHMPYKINVSFESLEGDNPAKVARITMAAIFKDWNKPMTIEAPDQSTPFQTFLESNLQTSSQKNSDSRLKASLSSARALAETHKQKTGSYKNFCQSSDVSDIKSGLSPASQVTYTCRDSISAFVIAAQLSAEPNAYFCADSSGSEIRIDKAPAGMSCK